jgi:hypothetical protein
VPPCSHPVRLAAEQRLTGPQKGHSAGCHWRPLELAGPALCPLFPSCLAAEQLLTGPQQGHSSGRHWRPLELAGHVLCNHVPILSVLELNSIKEGTIGGVSRTGRTYMYHVPPIFHGQVADRIFVFSQSDTITRPRRIIRLSRERI